MPTCLKLEPSPARPSVRGGSPAPQSPQQPFLRTLFASTWVALRGALFLRGAFPPDPLRCRFLVVASAGKKNRVNLKQEHGFTISTGCRGPGPAPRKPGAGFYPIFRSLGRRGPPSHSLRARRGPRGAAKGYSSLAPSPKALPSVHTAEPLLPDATSAWQCPRCPLPRGRPPAPHTACPKRFLGRGQAARTPPLTKSNSSTSSVR